MNSINTSQYQYDAIRYQKYYRDLSRFYKKPVAQVSSALLLTLFTVIFFAVFAIMPTLETISELIRKIEDQELVLADLEKKSSALAVVQGEYDLIKRDLPHIEAAVPETAEIDQIILALEGIIAQNNLPITSLNVDSFSFVQKPKTQKEEDNQSKLNLSLKAPYPVLQKVIKDIQTTSRLFTIEELKFDISEETDDPEENPTLSLSIALKAYYQPKLKTQ